MRAFLEAQRFQAGREGKKIDFPRIAGRTPSIGVEICRRGRPLRLYFGNVGLGRSSWDSFQARAEGCNEYRGTGWSSVGISNRMTPRVLFVKQAIDVFGPWRSITWQDETPISVLNSFLYKATFWEMTGFLRADWRIVPTIDESDNHYYQAYINPFPRVCRLLEHHQTDICRLEEISFDHYDLVIANEPCIPLSIIKNFPQTKFVYFMNEHWPGPVYIQEKLNTRPGYAAFLDHMCGEIGEPGTRVVHMPYLREPDMVRKCFPRTPQTERPRIWLDARTVLRETASPGVCARVRQICRAFATID